MRALVVDDSRAIRAILRQSLVAIGFEVFDAGNGQEALAKLAETGVVDLACVDWNMPVMNGLEFVKAARANDALTTMQILMVTTETEVDQMVSALTAGANEYLMKPFTKEAVAEKVTMLGLPLRTVS